MLRQWLLAHGAPDSGPELVGGDFQCDLGWSADCVSVNGDVAAVLLEFVAEVHW